MDRTDLESVKKMTLTKTDLKQVMGRLLQFLSYLNAGPQQDWDRAYLCSVAPLSAGALRVNEEAQRTHTLH